MEVKAGILAYNPQMGWTGLCYDKKVMDHYWDTLKMTSLEREVAERGNFDKCHVRRDWGWETQKETNGKFQALPVKFNMDTLKFNDLETLERRC